MADGFLINPVRVDIGPGTPSPIARISSMLKLKRRSAARRHSSTWRKPASGPCLLSNARSSSKTTWAEKSAKILYRIIERRTVQVDKLFHPLLLVPFFTQ
jgi:hypothetical protein